jgi:hypothetical protein
LREIFLCLLGAALPRYVICLICGFFFKDLRSIARRYPKINLDIFRSGR